MVSVVHCQLIIRGLQGVAEGVGEVLVIGSHAVGAVVFVAPSTKMVASWWRAQRKLSMRGVMGLTRDGWASAVVRLLAAAMARSAEDATGMM